MNGLGSLPLRCCVSSLLVLIYKHCKLVSYHPFVLLNVQCCAQFENFFLWPLLFIRYEGPAIGEGSAARIRILPVLADAVNLLLWLFLVFSTWTKFVRQKPSLHINILTHMLTEWSLLSWVLLFEGVDDDPLVLLNTRIDNSILQIAWWRLCPREPLNCSLIVAEILALHTSQVQQRHKDQ